MTKEHKLISNYLSARATFLKESARYSSLSGNDNIIGRIGEYVAMCYLKNENPVKAKVSNQCSWDLVLGNRKKISVRMITSENKRGKTTPIKILRKDGTKTEWDELILILLENNAVTRIGRITRKDFIRQFNLRVNPRNIITDRRFLDEGGVFDQCNGLDVNFNMKF